jgi:hypothetical protein
MTSELALSCKKCRSKLFSAPDLVEKHAFLPSSSCSSYFLRDAPEWFDPMSTGENEGKLSCPKCETRIGNWNWSGVRCSCSEWVTPGFQLHVGKLDHNRFQFQQRGRNIPVIVSASVIVEASSQPAVADSLVANSPDVASDA